MLVLFITTIGVAAPLKNDPIISVRSIQSFRHLELQNPSIISDFRHRSRMVQQFQRNGGTEEEEWRRRRNGGTEHNGLVGWDMIHISDMRNIRHESGVTDYMSHKLLCVVYKSLVETD